MGLSRADNLERCAAHVQDTALLPANSGEFLLAVLAEDLARLLEALVRQLFKGDISTAAQRGAAPA